jgi:hypothetical protein
MALKSRFKRNERRQQLLKRHGRALVDRRNKWFYLTETCNRPMICPNTPDPESGNFNKVDKE